METSDNYRQRHVKFVSFLSLEISYDAKRILFYLSVINKLGSKEDFPLTLLL